MDVSAIGELLIDFTCIDTDADGYPTMQAHPGGAPANYLAALAKFGMKTAFIGKVGEDAFGRLLRGSLEKAGIDTRGLISAEDVFTTLAFVTLDAKGDREFSFARKPGADTALRQEELCRELIAESRLLHFGTLSLTDEPARSATYAAVDYARKLGKLVSFDPNLRRPLWKSEEDAKEQMLWGLAHADMVKISDEELDFLFGLKPGQGGAYIRQRFGAKLVFVTCGAQGCYFSNEGAEGFVPALSSIKVTDTTGAGDIFFGSAVSRILALGKAPGELEAVELREICAFAAASAGLSATRAGGISSVPEREEVLEKMKELC